MKPPVQPGRIPSILPILDVGLANRPLDELVAAFAAGGAEWLQLRDKSADDKTFHDSAVRVRDAARRHGLYVMINDRVAVAAALGLGAHVGQRDLPAAAARELIGRQVLGLSTHDRGQLRAAEELPIDYLAIGPVFATFTKPAAGSPIGLVGLQAARRATCRPLVAIGGIDAGNAAAVTGAGADCIAAASSLLLADEPAAATASLRAAAEEGLRRRDD